MSASPLPNIPVSLFQITSRGLELLNRGWEDYPGLTPNRWLGISRGGWRSLVPEEYHPEVAKLASLPVSDTYTVVEFPVYWQDTTVWLLVFAAAVAETDGERKVVGLVQEISQERQWPPAARIEAAGEQGAQGATALRSASTPADEAADSVEDLCHHLSGPLTSILVNCEVLMDSDCTPPVRERLEGIFNEAMQINQHLRSYRRAG
jgi:hypothetical protein